MHTINTRTVLLTLCATTLGISALAWAENRTSREAAETVEVLFAQDEAGAQEQMPPMEVPTAEHRALIATQGTWTGTMSMPLPDGTTMTARATETNTPIGAFWSQSTFSCEFMGMPYVGTGSMGYNPKTKKFIGTWVDNMTSFLALMEGEMSSDGKTLTMSWDAPDETGKIVQHRSETQRTEDSYMSTFFMGAGKGVQGMVISMKRATTAEASSDR